MIILDLATLSRNMHDLYDTRLSLHSYNYAFLSCLNHVRLILSDARRITQAQSYSLIVMVTQAGIDQSLIPF